jgi:hypothetical protein
MQCKLCHQEAELRNSHIIPEFLYANLYDEKGRYHIVSNVHGKLKKPEQKGLREHLLCGACEGKFSRWETYAANVLYHKNKTRSQKIDGTIVVDSLDYTQFKLFLLSLIWRAGISSLMVFRETTLGPHEDKLRAMLLAGDPGPRDMYGCLVFAITIDGYPLDQTIYGPQPCWLGNHRCYRLMVGSLLFIYFISSHPPEDIIIQSFLSEQGRLHIPIKKLEDVVFLDSLRRELKSTDRK